MRRLAILAVLVGFGCGSNSDPAPKGGSGGSNWMGVPPGTGGSGGSGGVSPAQARADCELFITSVVCPKIVACDNTTTQAACVTAIRTTVDCTKVVGEGGSFSACASQFSNSDCGILLAGGAINSPAACNNIFLTP